jgi:hypothetical protein
VYEDGDSEDMTEDQVLSFITVLEPNNVIAQALRITARARLQAESKMYTIVLYPNTVGIIPEIEDIHPDNEMVKRTCLRDD